MRYLTIAGIHIHVSGFDYEYFDRRTAEYVSEKKDPDLTVSVELCEHISVPDTDVFVVNGYRHFCKTDNGYCLYDLYKGRCVAVVYADKDWKSVNACLADVKDIGGSDFDIRRFNLLGMAFRQRILRFGGIAYHSSTVCYKNKGIVFTAPSGTGKSTHTELWTKYCEGAFVLNDDTPAIRIIDGKVVFFGTPWSGKTEINRNVSCEGAAIVFLQRGENKLKQVSGIDAYKMLIGGVMSLPVFEEDMNLVLSVLQEVSSIPTYVLYCDISREAVETVRNEIFK